MVVQALAGAAVSAATDMAVEKGADMLKARQEAAAAAEQMKWNVIGAAAGAGACYTGYKAYQCYKNDDMEGALLWGIPTVAGAGIAAKSFKII